MPKFNMKDLDNYEPPKSDTPDFTDGEYQVKGVRFLRDKNDNPILKLIGDKLRAGINYILYDGSVGPFGTMELFKVNVLQNAFNKEAQFQIPPVESDAPKVAEFLKQVEHNINAAGNTITLTVIDGYAAFVSGQQVPANCDYSLKVIDVLTRDETTNEPSYYTKTWPNGNTSKQFKIWLEIQPGKFGHPFSGCRFKADIPYGFMVKNGNVQWTVDDEGKRTTSSKVAHSFYKLTAPQMFDNEITESDAENLVKYWYHNANLPSSTFKVFVKGTIGKYGATYYNPQWFKAEIVEEEVIDDDVPDGFFQNRQR